MPTLNDIIPVTININTLRPSFPGFGIPLFVDKFASFSSDSSTARYRKYTSMQDIAVDWKTTDKIYKMANALYQQPQTPQYMYVGRFDTTGPDASYSAALIAILASLTDFYAIAIASNAAADIESAADWIESNGKVAMFRSEDAAVIAAGVSDVASYLQSKGYNRSALLWHYQSGVDIASGVAVISGTAPSLTVVVTKTAHGFRAGDTAIISGVTDTSFHESQMNGEWVITLADANTFTFLVPSFTMGATTAVPVPVAYSRYLFPDCAWLGNLLPFVPGQVNAAYKNLVGQNPAPLQYLTETQEQIALGKNASVYSALGGIGITRLGTMGSGRFWDIQVGIDWFQANLQQAIYLALLQSPKIPYTDAGLQVIVSAIESVIAQGVNNGLFGPLLDSPSNIFSRIFVPKVASQTSANRQARYFPGIRIQVQLAGAINKLAITVNANI